MWWCLSFRSCTPIAPCGDCNDDGIVSSGDALTAQQHVSGTVTLNDTWIPFPDENNSISVFDLVFVPRVSIMSVNMDMYGFSLYASPALKNRGALATCPSMRR